MRDQALFIDGEWRDTAEHRTILDKYSGETIGSVAVATVADATAAVDAAERALAVGWSIPDRARVLANTARLISEHADDLAESITAETGKPISASRAEVSRAVETVAIGAGTFAFTIPVARGIVAAITPFNFPLNLLLHKVGPALAAGCPVVVKPSDHAPLTAGLIVELFEQSGLPAGWLNLVTGPPEDIVGAWQSDPRVAVITFTGSSKVGWQLKAQSPKKHHVLELGSNTALVVAADADLDRAARAAADAALGNSGQTCVSLQRIYVEKAIASDFTSRLGELVGGAAFGDPRDPKTVVGPLISADATTRLTRWIDDALADGAQAIVGGALVDGMLPPTVLTNVPSASPLICEEAFGPVVSVIVVDDLAEAITHVNAADYGLNTAIYTSGLAAAMNYARLAEVGSVLVNMPPSFRADHMPYGGVKGSGQGREGVKYAIADLVQQKLVVLHP
jgi:acyl-CoA reductase-like NAD-dependent aldehyde dehydrogenase